MLSSSSLLYKEHLYSFLRPWLGDGLLTSSGARWLKHQKLYVPAFERAAIEGYLRVVHRTGEKFVQKLAQQADEQQPFDAQQLVAKCTLDIVCGKVGGQNFKHLSQPFCTAAAHGSGQHSFIFVIYYGHFINKIYGLECCNQCHDGDCAQKSYRSRPLFAKYANQLSTEF